MLRLFEHAHMHKSNSTENRNRFHRRRWAVFAIDRLFFTNLSHFSWIHRINLARFCVDFVEVELSRRCESNKSIELAYFSHPPVRHWEVHPTPSNFQARSWFSCSCAWLIVTNLARNYLFHSECQRAHFHKRYDRHFSRTSVIYCVPLDGFRLKLAAHGLHCAKNYENKCVPLHIGWIGASALAICRRAHIKSVL